MASIKGRNTSPELILRHLLHSRGKRYRIHNKRIFGIPDISNARKKVAIFVDGCFWHGCSKCYNEPKTNTEFWRRKLTNNQERRRKVRRTLKADGWNVTEIWEHDILERPALVTEKLLLEF